MLFVYIYIYIYILPFDLDIIHIKQHHLHNMKIRQTNNIILICTTMSNKILLITLKQARVCL